MFRVLFGISGSIAAYKALEVIRGLRRFGIEVVPLMTQAAESFVTPLSVEVLAEHEVYLQSDAMRRMSHIALTKKADMLVVCPASADTIAKCRWGTTDSLLTATWSAFAGPKLIVPAMHTDMYTNPATQENIQWLKSHGVYVLGPVSGDLACGDVGEGRLADPELITRVVYGILFGLRYGKDLRPCLVGKRVLITAGGTKEPLDPVRYLGNRSSGLLGHTLAELAACYGAAVTLVSTVPLSSPLPGVSYVGVSTAAEMANAVFSHVAGMDCVIMAAAVADFTIVPVANKMKRDQSLTLSLSPTQDILQQCPRHPGLRVIGFCLEDHDPVGVGREKMRRKSVDVMVCNTSASFGAQHREITLLEGDCVDHLRGTVQEIAAAILERV